MTDINWHTIPLDRLASIVEDDKEMIRQLDEQGTPSASVRVKIAERAAIYKERTANTA